MRRFRGIGKSFSIVLGQAKPRAARVALMLKKRGVERVWPLEGGFEAWVAAGRRVEPREEES